MIKKKNNVTIRLANEKDLIKILKFLKLHWNPKHIYLRELKFFNYELNNSFPQFILAIKNKSIIGLVGFYHYEKNYKKSDIFLALLRVIDKYANYQIAAKLIVFSKTLTDKNIHTVGATKETLPLYKLFNFKTGWLDHFYWINSNIKEFKICKINLKIINNFKNYDKILNLKFYKISKTLNKKNYDIFKQKYFLRKSFWYFKKRYLNHPIYNYEIFLTKDFKNFYDGIGVIRIININQSKCIKIIDWMGNVKKFKQFCIYITQFATSIDAEFIDLYCSGINLSEINQSGFKKVGNSVIIPNHLSPIEYKNHPISFVSSDTNNLVFFRGDCDQDRPN